VEKVLQFTWFPLPCRVERSTSSRSQVSARRVSLASGRTADFILAAAAMIRGILSNSFVRPTRFGCWGPLVLTALVACANSTTTYAKSVTAPSACAPELARPQDQLWLVSARHLGCAAAGVAPEKLGYWHYLPGVGWQRSTSQEFLASDDPAAITQIWIHGNQIEASGAFEVGWTVYSSVARRAISERPLRFVIWSWPSEKVGRLLEDAQEKAARTGPAAFNLARFIDQIHSDVQVGLIGYSYGARVVIGSLQLLAGGNLNGRAIPLQNAAARRPIDVVLIAAAADSGTLLPGRSGGRALDVTGRMLLVENSCDQALRFYHFLYGRRSCVEALGRVGVGYTGQLGANGAKITQFDACCMVGSEHYWANYFASSSVMGRIEPLVFSPDAGSATADGDHAVAAQ
jgi:hypothetical protein